MIEQIPATAYNTPSLPSLPPMIARMTGAIAGAMELGRAPAMLSTPGSLALLSLSGQHVGSKREVDGHVQADAEAADGHADEVAVEVAGDGDGDGEHRQAVHGRGGQDEDLPSACPRRRPART